MHALRKPTFLRIVIPIALLVASSVRAQTTWVVDAAGGGDFRTIGAALVTAANGDTVLVRAGNYPENPVTDEGLLIVGDPGARLLGLPAARFTVSGLAAGKTFVLRGFSFDFAGAVIVASCRGRVLLEELDLTASPVASGSLEITDADQVAASRVRVHGYPPVRCRNSRVHLHACDLSVRPLVQSLPALLVDGGHVSIVEGNVLGGAASAVSPPSEAIRLTNAELTLAGRSTSIAAGNTTRPADLVSAVTGSGVIHWEPAVALRSANNAPPIGGTATVQVGRIASVSGGGIAPGGFWSLELHAPTGSPCCLFLGLPAPLRPTGFGELWFEPVGSVVLTCATVAAGDVLRFHLSIPPGVPRGLAGVVQAAVEHSGGIEISQPTWNAVR